MLLSQEIKPTTLHLEDQLRNRAIALRKNATPAENILWQYVRAKRLDGIKFRRQHTLHGRIVDFYCYKYRLVIEIDGGVHDDRKIQDQQRDIYLQQRGYTILRFSNDAIVNNLDQVLSQIKERFSPPALGGVRGGV